MPGRDGTGPMGAGAMTGNGMGFCTDTDSVSYGAGRGRELGSGACRRGFGRGFGRGIASNGASKTHKELLREQRDALKSRLEVIDRQLLNL